MRNHLPRRFAVSTGLVVSHDGGPMDRRQPQDIHVPLFNNFIPPGAARTVHYRFKVPADAAGSVTLSAAANYRKFSRDYSIFVGGENAPELPTTRISTDSVTLPISAENAKNAPAAADGHRHVLPDTGGQFAGAVNNLLTADLARITLAGAIYLALVALLPEFMLTGFKVEPIPFIGDWLDARLPTWFTQGMNVQFYFGGTSLLIVVGVAMDTVQQVESQLIMRHYDGFMKKTRIRGRRGWRPARAGCDRSRPPPCRPPASDLWH